MTGRSPHKKAAECGGPGSDLSPAPAKGAAASACAFNCAGCHVLHRSDWAVLDRPELEDLGRRRVRKDYKAGEVIYEYGDQNRGVYCVSVGTVGVRRIDEHGNSVLLALAYAGDTLGYRSFLNGGAHRTSAEALGPSTVCFVDRRVLAPVLASKPALAEQFLRRATGELERAYESMFHNATLSNRARLAQVLLALLTRHGCDQPDGSRVLELPLSRRDLASMVGARHETVSRIISRLEDDGVASFSGRRVYVPSVQALVRECAPQSAG